MGCLILRLPNDVTCCCAATARDTCALLLCETGRLRRVEYRGCKRRHMYLCIRVYMEAALVLVPHPPLPPCPPDRAGVEVRAQPAPAAPGPEIAEHHAGWSLLHHDQAGGLWHCKGAGLGPAGCNHRGSVSQPSYPLSPLLYLVGLRHALQP